MIRETVARWIMCTACVVALAALIPACPHPGPSPVTPDASDAAPAPTPATCGPSCLHAVNVCPGVKQATCLDICGREPPAYAAALMAATGCPDVKAADPGSVGATTGTPAKPIGR